MRHARDRSARPNADLFLAADILLRHLRRGGAAGLPVLTETQWSSVVDEAVRQRITPMAWRRLTLGPARNAVPERVMERLRDLYLRNAFRNTVLLRDAAELAARLAQRGVPVVFLKGVHLAACAYAEPALRSMADIDLMVPRDLLADVDRMFVEWGWGPLPRPDIAAFCRRYPHTAPLHKEGSFPIEVHWSIERPTSPFSIDLDGLWERARTIDLCGVSTRVLSTEDLLLHLCLHTSYHHRFDRAPLKSLVDVAVVADRHEGEIDWSLLAGRAAAWGATRFVYSTLRLARDVLDAAIPEGALDPLDHEPADEEVVRVARQYIVTPPIELPVAYKELRDTHSLRGRAAWFTRNIFLPPQRMRQLYHLPRGSRLIYLYYLFRPFDLLIRRGLLMLRVALRTPALKPTLERERNRERINAWVESSGVAYARAVEEAE
ncbi:MAG: nucleotidyltransferase family protein [Gemmatimonadetes bacterium]|nr:nucleotidyltransferase family protein [Gemmatimonadota bacterium]